MRIVPLFFFLLLSSCSSRMSSINKSSQARNFDLQGHRGCRGLMPENTIPAMIRAIDLGVTTLEMDAVITKDGQVVVSHEPFSNHEISSKPNGDLVTEKKKKG